MAYGALTVGTSDGQAGPRLMPESRMGKAPTRKIPRVPNEKSVDRQNMKVVG
jgi:hypothetical protein